MNKSLPSIVAALLICAGCSTTNTMTHPTASATLWMQNSAEYDAITRQIFKTASDHIQFALYDSSWTASLEQKNGDYRGLPPAVIVDVDETVLDNAPFQARMIQQDSGFKPAEWTRWVREAQAEPVEGALEFTKEAARNGITVFYITNREHTVEEATRINLDELGFPLPADEDVILTKNERPNWTSDKTTRRAFVGKSYRILMLVGDDLNDFTSAKYISITNRHRLADNFEDKWGRQWFILPNPVYGSWEQALYNFDDSLTEEERKQAKEDRLETKEN